VGAGVVIALGALVLALLRVGSTLDSEDQSFEMAWRTASPKRAPLSAQQMQSISFRGELSQSGLLAGTTDSPDGRVTLVTVRPGTDEVLTWLSHSLDAGHVQTLVPSADGLQLAYVWIDKSCRCASIRVVNRRGTDRTLFTRPELRGAWLGEWREDTLPALLAPEHGPHELALVDVSTGSIRIVRQVERDPQGFSLSPDRRFLAFDAPTHHLPGALREIVVLDLETGRLQAVANADQSLVIPRWSPDGSHLFFLERGREDTGLLAVRMGQGRPVRRPVKLKDSLSSEGSFAFVSGTALGYRTAPRRNFFTVQAQADGTFNADSAVRPTNSRGTMPAWSRDGRWLAWADLGERAGAIRIQGADGRPERSVSAFLDTAIFPTWSPDGRRLAFWTKDPLTRSVQIVDLASGTSTEYMRRGHPFFGAEYGLSWTGDGKNLLISPGLDEILALDAERGALRTLYKPDSAAIEEYFYLSPDGHSLALVEVREQKRHLRVIPLDSQGTTARLDDSESYLIGWHPDGRSLLVIRRVANRGQPG
jgi:WD40-like Beta Propeller Repeat